MKNSEELLLLWNIMYIRGMYSNIDLFKIETNHVVPARGKVLISEPFCVTICLGDPSFYWWTIHMTAQWDWF